MGDLNKYFSKFKISNKYLKGCSTSLASGKYNSNPLHAAESHEDNMTKLTVKKTVAKM